MWFVNHKRCNADMGAPQGMESSVEMLRIENTVSQFGGRQMTSFWKPNEEDLKLLNAGGVVALAVHADRHPIISMSVEEA